MPSTTAQSQSNQRRHKQTHVTSASAPPCGDGLWRDFPTKNFPTKNFPTKNFPTKNFPTKNFPTKNFPISHLGPRGARAQMGDGEIFSRHILSFTKRRLYLKKAAWNHLRREGVDAEVTCVCLWRRWLLCDWAVVDGMISAVVCITAWAVPLWTSYRNETKSS